MELLIINHHYIRENIYKKGIYPTSTEKLESNIKKLLSKGWYPIDIENLVSKNVNEGKKYFLITFDDGLKCSIKNGLPILYKFSIKGIYFIPTKILSGEPLDVHLIHFVRSQISDEEILYELEKLSLTNVELDMQVVKKQYRYDDENAAKLKYILNFCIDEKTRRNFLIKFIEKILPDGIEEFMNITYMNHEEIKTLLNENMVGSHGHSHLPMAKLEDEKLQYELLEPKNVFKIKFGYDGLDIISYPYGGPSAVSERLFTFSQKAGYKIGLTMKRGINTQTDLFESPLKLKRIDVNDLEDWI